LAPAGIEINPLDPSPPAAARIHTVIIGEGKTMTTKGGFHAACNWASTAAAANKPNEHVNASIILLDWGAKAGVEGLFDAGSNPPQVTAQSMDSASAL
jgi:hypothetical protein